MWSHQTIGALKVLILVNLQHLVIILHLRDKNV